MGYGYFILLQSEALPIWLYFRECSSRSATRKAHDFSGRKT